jgi:hypothetical protein
MLLDTQKVHSRKVDPFQIVRENVTAKGSGRTTILPPPRGPAQVDGQQSEWSEADQIRTQSERESRLMDFAFDQDQAGRDKFVNTLHMFFSPYMITDGLTIDQARLLYIIALHYKTKFGGETLPSGWLHNDGKPMSDERFIQGLKGFMKGTIGTGGFWHKENELAIMIVRAGVSEVTPENTVRVAEFVGV